MPKTTETAKKIEEMRALNRNAGTVFDSFSKPGQKFVKNCSLDFSRDLAKRLWPKGTVRKASEATLLMAFKFAFIGVYSAGRREGELLGVPCGGMLKSATKRKYKKRRVKK